MNPDAAFWGWAVLHLLLLWLAVFPFLSLRSYIKNPRDIKIHSKLCPPEGDVRTLRRQNEAYVLFLSGVGRVSSQTMSMRERGILQRLAQLCPTTVVLDDVFAYSINNLPLTEDRRLSRYWRWVMRQKLKKNLLHSLIGYLINFRNIVQITMSADSRYSQIYNVGFARVLVHHLQQYGYEPERPKPVFIVSYSGAGQIAAGAVKHLTEHGLPVYALMLACFFTEGPGIANARHVWEFIGSADVAYRFCFTFTPSRWQSLPSPWSRLIKDGKMTRVDMGAMRHTGRGGYLDRNSYMPDGASYIDFTATKFAEIINAINTQYANEHPAPRREPTVP